jgi:hypothetical protein
MTTPGPWQPAFDRAADVAGRLQGEVLVVRDACVVVADAAWPMDQRSEAEAAAVGRTGLVVVPHPTDLVVLLTQTCDLQQTHAQATLCQVALVVEGVEEAFAHQVARGRHPGWVSLPWHDPLSVGDLSRITTLQRSVIVGSEGRGRPRNPSERLCFAEAVSRHLTRIAFPDAVSRVLAPVLERMRERHDRHSPEGQCIAKVTTLRLEAAPDLDADVPDLTVLAILDAGELPSLPPHVAIRQGEVDALVARGKEAAARAVLDAVDARTRREAWQALAELWLRPAVAAAGVDNSGVGNLDVEVLNGDEFSFARSRNAPELDLAYLSTRAA